MPSTCTKGYYWPGFLVSASRPRSSAPRAGELDPFLVSLPEVADRSYRGADSSCRGLDAPSVAGHIAGSFRRGRARWGPAHMRRQRPMQDWVRAQTTQSKPSQRIGVASGVDQLENLTRDRRFLLAGARPAPPGDEPPLWADLCRSGAMLEGRCRAQSYRLRRLKMKAGSRGPLPRKPLIVWTTANTPSVCDPFEFLILVGMRDYTTAEPRR
jgi:hypothetical protein